MHLLHSLRPHCQVSAQLAQRHGGKVNGLLAAERLTIAKQLEQHYCTNGAATGAVHDRKVTGELIYPAQPRAAPLVANLPVWPSHSSKLRAAQQAVSE